MKKLLLGLLFVATMGCNQQPIHAPEILLTPEPVSLHTLDGASLQQKTEIRYQQDDSQKDEGYQLVINNGVATIRSKDERGKFYAQQTLKQLQFAQDGKAYLPNCEITDYPRFGYRGFMLDEARHFFGKQTVKLLLDYMAANKLNKFHWHLTDDQGWRIEIKKYPKLTQVGGFRAGTQVGWKPDIFDCETDGKRYGGFYTQEDIKEIIAYAAKLHIDVIPEIDMPGHMMAAMTAYPELGENKDYKVRQYWGIAHEVLDVSKPETVQFAKDVLTEVAQLFPYQTIHIGGDECPKEQWKKSKSCQALMKKLNLPHEEDLQAWFMKTMEKHVKQYGKSIAGWDEILDGNISNTATVFKWRFWTKEDNAVVGARRGNPVIQCPNNRTYFDHYATAEKDKYEPLGFPAVTPIDRIYNWNPMPAALEPQYQDKIKGVAGNLWTEYVTSEKTLCIRVFPRMQVLAEVAWSPQQNRKVGKMNRKLSKLFKTLDAAGVPYNEIYIQKGHELIAGK
ncbi:beta-N-acetylhexosaminidase [Persicobacter psychrovividus]|uniref:beta-N-acetylhexosaminidase n=1 Tax=Persicobacter psychrovividus TaxID=387638 RepID=A0ABM7VJN7_9BACT|nr:hypothetical protein PEPS_34710 [Persicobacter psychrovividus]